jgi:formylmethanofuran dehydrogenase subunit E
MGRYNLYVDDKSVDSSKWIHEDEAAEAFAIAMAGEGTRPKGKPKEGKVNIVADQSGLLLIDTERLYKFNLIPDVMAASRKNYTRIKKDKQIAGTRAIPLYLSRDLFNAAMAVLAEKPLFEVRPFKPAKIGIMVTGTEIFQGLVKDKFEAILSGKVLQYECSVAKTIIVPDDRRAITDAVKQLIDAGSEIIITTAGLSVDPEDLTLFFNQILKQKTVYSFFSNSFSSHCFISGLSSWIPLRSANGFQIALCHVFRKAFFAQCR